eukprot:8530257-Alexandrium_andersonii.AAC.1
MKTPPCGPPLGPGTGSCKLAQKMAWVVLEGGGAGVWAGRAARAHHGGQWGLQRGPPGLPGVRARGRPHGRRLAWEGAEEQP